MAQQLKALSDTWDNVNTRLLAVWGDLTQLIAEYQHPNSGAWPRVVDMYEMLEERLAALGANTAQDPAAANDNQVQRLVTEIDRGKALCRKKATEFYAKKGNVFRDLGQLKAEVDRVYKSKAGFLSRSKSVPALKNLQATVSTMLADANQMLTLQPHRPDDPAIN